MWKRMLRKLLKFCAYFASIAIAGAFVYPTLVFLDQRGELVDLGEASLLVFVAWGVLVLVGTLIVCIGCWVLMEHWIDQWLPDEEAPRSAD